MANEFIIKNGFLSKGNSEIDGRTKTTNLQITSGAVNGYVLTSDEIGNGSWQPSSGGSSLFTGGTVNGSTIFTNGLTANSLTVNGVQITGDTYVTGGTYSNGTLTFTDNQNNSFQVTGVTSSGGSGTFTGGTVNGSTNFTNGLTANTLTVNGVQITGDTYVTGGTYSSGTLTFTNNQNNTFQVTGVTSSGGSSFGIFGISNSSGEYTYYSTLQSAIDNANFGDVIQMFSNVVESNSVTVNLKNGVDINMNGYSYILNGNNVNHCLSDNNVAVNCKIYNGNIVRSGATYVDDVKSLCLYVQNSGTIIETSGVYFENPTTTGINNNGTLKGAIVNAYTRGIVNKRKLYSVDVTATFETAIYCDAATSEVYDSIGRSLGGGYGIGMLMPSLGVGLLINSKGYAVGLSGILVGGLDKMLNCVGYSNSNNGIYAINTYAVENCSAYSNSAVAFYCSNVVAISNILGYSFSSFGVYLFSQGPTIYMTAQNVISESLTNTGCWLSTDPSSGGFLVVKNLQATSSLSGTAGVACRIGGNGVTILGGSLSVRNSSQCLSAPAATTLKYAGLILKTSASPAISANITQGITSSGDSQNNIIVV